jgi:hypothetical protein
MDPVEWFLFDYKKGYCDYYATAEVLLLREVGVPARLAVGFAQGTITNPQSAPSGGNMAADGFTVRYKDSHAWPQIYFNDYGWIEFEPTVSQPVLNPPTGDPNQHSLTTDPTEHLPLRDLTEGAGSPSSGLNTAAQDAAAFISTSSRSTIFWILIAAALGLMAVAAWRLHFRKAEAPAFPVWLEQNLSRRGWAVPKWLKRWSRWALFSPLQRAYGAINQALSLLGRPARPSQTPAERSAVLEGLLPQVALQSQTVVNEYQQAQYGKHSGNADSARTASQQIRQESFKALLLRLIRR